MTADPIIIIDQPETALVPDETYINGAAAGLDDTAWLNYFDPDLAQKGIAMYCASQPGHSRGAKTMANYMNAITRFRVFSMERLPSPTMVTGFVAYLRSQGLSTNTIRAKYFTGLRHYFRALLDQHIIIDQSADFRQQLITRTYIEDCRHQLRQAANVKTPRPEKRANVGRMFLSGQRLGVAQVNRIFHAIDRTTLAGKRDYALLQIAFTIGLRVDELRRLTLNSFTTEDDVLMVRVTGKNDNIDPVSIDDHVYEYMMEYVNAWNAFMPDDPRYIAGDLPVFQAINKGDKPMSLGRYKPSNGVSTRSIARIVGDRAAAVGIEGFSPHDCRRTLAYLLLKSGVDLVVIQEKLRHASPVTTKNYTGELQDYAGSRTANFLVFG